MRTKSKTVNVRLDSIQSKFIEQMSKQLELTKSEFIRNIIEYMFVAMFLDKLPRENLEEMRNEFAQRFKT